MYWLWLLAIALISPSSTKWLMAARARLPLIYRGKNREWKQSFRTYDKVIAYITYSQPVSKHRWSDHLVLWNFRHELLIGRLIKENLVVHLVLVLSLGPFLQHTYMTDENTSLYPQSKQRTVTFEAPTALPSRIQSNTYLLLSLARVSSGNSLSFLWLLFLRCLQLYTSRKHKRWWWKRLQVFSHETEPPEPR